MTAQPNQLNHLAIIPDGNSRWGKANQTTPFTAYQRGMERGIELTRYTRTIGIHTVTFWGLSTENWLHRPKAELNFLFGLFERSLDEYADDADEAGARIIHIGNRGRLPSRLLNKLAQMEKRTRRNDKHILNLALDYGGQDEIIRAARRATADVKSGKIPPDNLDAAAFASYLDTGDQPHPNPDLIIRTSGEQRLSGFMPWQSVYSELHFEQCFFPDFTTGKLDAAVANFHQRKRRFGGGH